MEFALGVLHWQPDAFWKSTMMELMTANTGHLKLHKPAVSQEPMSRNEYQELRKKLGM